jgi:hypothetical protein
MRNTIVLAILLALGLGSVAFPDDQCPEALQALPLCTVLISPDQYDSKEIMVRGLYRVVIHGSVLMGTACPQMEVNLREGPGYRADKRASAVVRSLTKKDQFHPVDEILRGTFRVARKEQCFGQICAPYEIEVTNLLCAQAPPKETLKTEQ